MLSLEAGSVSARSITINKRKQVSATRDVELALTTQNGSLLRKPVQNMLAFI